MALGGPERPAKADLASSFQHPDHMMLATPTAPARSEIAPSPRSRLFNAALAYVFAPRQSLSRRQERGIGGRHHNRGGRPNHSHTGL
jgi:hypothetical protein